MRQTQETKKTPEIGLGISRLENETWRECALRYGKHYGMEGEIEDSFNDYVARGDAEEEAAWAACLDWDVASIFKDGIEQRPPKDTVAK